MKFEVIQNLKKSELFYQKINFGRVITAKLYTEGMKNKISCILLYLFFEQKIKYINNESNLLISYPFEKGKRKDYEEITETLKDICKNYNEIFLYKKVNLYKFFIKLYDLLKQYHKNKNLKLSRIENLQVGALYLYFKNFFDDELKKIIFKENTYISFCDSYLQENLLTQHLKNQNKITITLQHGQYRQVKKGYETTDCESYLNFVSDYICVWGQKTKDELLKVGIDENKILNLGSLKGFYKNYGVKNNISKLNKKFCVILNGETHSESNFRLLKNADLFSEMTGYKYYLRPHPMNKVEKYLEKINKKNLIKLINGLEYEEIQVEFNILHMTGVFVELLSKNNLFFVLDDEWTEDIFKIDGFTFKNEQELYSKYSKIIVNRENILKNFKNEYLRYNCVKNYDELKNNYRQQLKKIGVL